MDYDVIVIGGGAAGMMATFELSNAGLSVCLLEASDRLGGRIASVKQEEFDPILETGAEFIHGDAPLTLELLRKSGIAFTPTEGEMINIRRGVWMNDEEQENIFELMGEKVKELRADMSIRAFLDEFFPAGEFDASRNLIRQMAEGFSLADIDKASVLAFWQDLSHLQETDYRITGGYQQLTDYLFECFRDKANVYYGEAVSRVDYDTEYGNVYTHSGNIYRGKKIVVAVSAGVLQHGTIDFNPGLGKYTEAIQQLGFGPVIKFLFLFNEAFWEKRTFDAGFFLSDEKVPTWWTQLPARSNLLTGWLGGTQAGDAGKMTDIDLYKMALNSLASIFAFDTFSLERFIIQHKIILWENDPYIKGGYSFNTLQSSGAKQILNEPIRNTLFFAGEAFYEGPFQGTVEAALASGKNVARKIIQMRDNAKK